MTRLDNVRDKWMEEFEKSFDDETEIATECNLENPEICESCQ